MTSPTMDEGEVEAVATGMLADLHDGKGHGCLIPASEHHESIVLEGHVDLRSLARAAIAALDRAREERAARSYASDRVFDGKRPLSPELAARLRER